MANYPVTVSESLTASEGVLSLRKAYTTVSDSITVTDSMTVSLKLSVSVAEVINAYDQFINGRLVAVSVQESLGVTDALSCSAKFHVLVEELLKVGVNMQFEGAVYDGLVFEANGFAASRYENFNFNSFCEYQGKYYGCKSDGIYELEGKDDDGEPISAVLSTGNIKFSGVNYARALGGYLMVKNDGTIKVRVIPQNGSPYTYNMAEIHEYHESARVPFGWGLRSVIWRFEIENDEGSNFDLDTFKVYPIELTKRT